MGKGPKDIYLDHLAASPVRREALEAMTPLLERGFGNPQSVHTRGQAAAEVLGRAREQVASLINAQPGGHTIGGLLRWALMSLRAKSKEQRAEGEEQRAKGVEFREWRR